MTTPLSLDTDRWVPRLSMALMLLQGVLLGLAAFFNSVTFDEVNHLPAGISYWDKGVFWCYHHNPPLIKLLFALPAVLIDVPTDYTRFQYVPGSRQPDFVHGHAFVDANRDHYELLYGVCRLFVVAITIWGGRIVFCWGREIYSPRAGLLAQVLWTLCPNVLAHGSLVTPDMGSTVFGFYATYRFWRYLKQPTMLQAAICGLWLGLTEASKFSFVILPAIWIAILIVHLLPKKEDSLRSSRTWTQLAGDGFVVLSLSLLVLNNIYLFEGVGIPLGEFQFVSKTLTVPSDDAQPIRVNRFQRTSLARIPAPFPAQYLLGFDDQLQDVDSGMFQVYLRGELSRGYGWWYYFLYGFLVKTPLGTLAIAVIAMISFVACRHRSRDWLGDATLLIPIVAFLVVISAGASINAHFRYALPVYPFCAVFLGGASHWFEQTRWRNWVLGGLLLSNVLSVGRVAPYFLTYFNEAVGGPRQGWKHLADSNIDWGQGLSALQSWLRQHGNGRPVQLAYFGGLYPEELGLEYELPGILVKNETDDVGPRPGLHVISASYLAGLNFAVPDGTRTRHYIPERAFAFYQQLEPIAVVANCLYVYELDEATVNRLRRDAGLPQWSGTASPQK